ncbi:MAG: hypothetical protein WBL29_01725 [Burkholderiales bacterium]
MPEPWLTIAPVRNFWHLPAGLQLPYKLNERTSFRRVPDWVLSDQSEESVDILRPRLRKALEDDIAEYCVAVEYEADSLGHPDPEWKGDERRSIQETSVEIIRNVFLSFWLVRSTSLHFREVAHAVNHKPEWVIRQIEKYDPICPLPEYVDDAYELEDFERVRFLFNALNTLPQDGTLRTATQSTMRALMEQGWTLRFLIMWLVLESLFGPEGAREITFRLSQRIALFLGSDTTESKELFSQVKTSYSWRSKIVHGFRLAKLRADESQELIVRLESLVSRSLVAILSDESLVATFDGKQREEYLDGIIFS